MSPVHADVEPEAVAVQLRVLDHQRPAAPAVEQAAAGQRAAAGDAALDGAGRQARRAEVEARAQLRLLVAERGGRPVVPGQLCRPPAAAAPWTRTYGTRS